MKKAVEKIFLERIKSKFGHIESIHKLLSTHERLSLVLDNACAQIEIAERKAYSIKWDVEKYRTLIHQVVDLFAGAVLKHSEESVISGIKKQTMIDESNRIKNLEEKFEADQKEALSDKIISYPSV